MIRMIVQKRTIVVDIHWCFNKSIQDDFLFNINVRNNSLPWTTFILMILSFAVLLLCFLTDLGSNFKCSLLFKSLVLNSWCFFFLLKRYQDLLDKGEERRKKLEGSIQRYSLLRDAHELESWINDKVSYFN